MKKIIDFVEEELSAAFEKAGYDRELAKVTLSNRPDLCEYQCNGAMAGAKALKQSPRAVAQAVVDHMDLEGSYFQNLEIAGPGF